MRKQPMSSHSIRPPTSGKAGMKRAGARREDCSTRVAATFAIFVLRLLVEITLILEPLEICQYFVERVDMLTRDAAGVVELTKQLEVLEILRRLQLALEAGSQ